MRIAHHNIRILLQKLPRIEQPVESIKTIKLAQCAADTSICDQVILIAFKFDHTNQNLTHSTYPNVKKNNTTIKV